tara:strand:+ start:115 stop:663 length:549 start_codon:yes stop_codon:yes gene_type:complete
MLKKLLTFSFLNIAIFQTAGHARDRVDNHLSGLLSAGSFQTTVAQSVPIYYQEDNEQSLESLQGISETIESMMVVTNYNNLETCQDIDIKIFIIEHNLLHDRSIMNFLTWNTMPENIWGAYDSFHDNETGELYINARASERFTKRVFAHEFWHHVQDITCTPRDEAEAQEFARKFCIITGEC